MKNFLWFLMLLCVVSCSDYVDRPNNLLTESQMAEVIADLAINGETLTVNPSANMESGTRYLLKKNKISANDFAESYKYYAITKKLDGILEDAQELIKERHPEAEKFIEKELKKNPQTTLFGR